MADQTKAEQAAINELRMVWTLPYRNALQWLGAAASEEGGELAKVGAMVALGRYEDAARCAEATDLRVGVTLADALRGFDRSGGAS